MSFYSFSHEGSPVSNSPDWYHSSPESVFPNFSPDEKRDVQSEINGIAIKSFSEGPSKGSGVEFFSKWYSPNQQSPTSQKPSSDSDLEISLEFLEGFIASPDTTPRSSFLTAALKNTPSPEPTPAEEPVRGMRRNTKFSDLISLWGV